MYQATMTSVGNDGSLTEVIYINPLNGHAVRYPITGRAVKGVKTLVQGASTRLNPQGFIPDQCQLQVLMNRNVWFCVLIGGGSDAGSYGGVAFVQERWTADNTKVIVARTLNDAYDQLRLQVSTESPDNPALAVSMEKIQLRGVLERKTTRQTASGVGVILFIMSGTDVPVNTGFKASGDNPVAGLMKEGDTITVTALKINTDGWTDVIDITNEQLPKWIGNSP